MVMRIVWTWNLSTIDWMQFTCSDVWRLDSNELYSIRRFICFSGIQMRRILAHRRLTLETDTRILMAIVSSISIDGLNRIGHKYSFGIVIVVRQYYSAQSRWAHSTAQLNDGSENLFPTCNMIPRWRWAHFFFNFGIDSAVFFSFMSANNIHLQDIQQCFFLAIVSCIKCDMLIPIGANTQKERSWTNHF